MISKLRRKFVLVNMLLVLVVLLVAFGAICFAYQSVLKAETQQALSQAILQHSSTTWTKPSIGTENHEAGDRVPTFTLMLDDEGDVSQILGRGGVLVSDAVVEQAARLVQEEDSDHGFLPELSLRYLRRYSLSGCKVAFADTSHETIAMRNLILILCGIGTLSLCAFLCISLFLFRKALQPVENAWVQQRRFVTDASHELKTPLTVILANLGILLAHPEDSIAQHRQWVVNSREEAERMKSLVEDMLFLAQSDAGALPAETESVNLSDLCWSSLLSFEAVAFEQGIRVRADIQPDLYLQGVEGQLRQLIGILLDNAVKYAGEGGWIRVALTRTDGKLMLAVSNSGDPIPEKDLPHIFDRFYRVDEARAGDSGGYGLGLAIAQRIVQNHGGRITAESSKEQGTVLRIRF
ncbi:MAG: HAMP domain-containing sensor histidine kinase [Butyricicoccus sp.]|nr:HAMP domain-containing sensor histidine kinase [Butyricicoccus sp.]